MSRIDPDDLDVSKWSESAFITSIEGPLCPRCQRVGVLEFTFEHTKCRAWCSNCEKVFWCNRVTTPLGIAYQTPMNQP